MREPNDSATLADLRALLDGLILDLGSAQPIGFLENGKLAPLDQLRLFEETNCVALDIPPGIDEDTSNDDVALTSLAQLRMQIDELGDAGEICLLRNGKRLPWKDPRYEENVDCIVFDVLSAPEQKRKPGRTRHNENKDYGSR